MAASDSQWLLNYLKPIVGDTHFEPLRRTGVFPKAIQAPEGSRGESWTLDVVLLDNATLPLESFKKLYLLCFDNYIATLLKATDDEREAMREHLFARFSAGDLLVLMGLRRVLPSGEATVSIVGHCIFVNVWTAEPRDVLGRPRQYGIWLKEAMTPFQQGGIGNDVLHEAILSKSPSFFCARTQIPSVLALFSHLRWDDSTTATVKSDSVVLPLAFVNAATGKPELPIDVQQFCLEVLSSVNGLKRSIPSYDPETMVLKQCFSTTVTRIPIPTQHPIWRFLRHVMNPAAGDALFSVVFPVTKKAAAHNAETIVARL